MQVKDFSLVDIVYTPIYFWDKTLISLFKIIIYY